MTQTTSRFFDEIARLMTDAAGAAQGVRKEVESLFRTQAEKMLNDLDVVQREEFEAVKAMAQKARAENEALARRVAELETRLSAASPKAAGKAVEPEKKAAKPKAKAATKATKGTAG